MRGASDRQPPLDPIEVLCAVLRSGEIRVRGASFGTMPELAPLISSGVLVERGVVSAIHCDFCDDGHVAKLDRHPTTGCPAYRCPESGIVELDSDEVRAFDVDMSAFTALCASAFNVPKRHQAEISTARLWRIGPAKADNGVVDVLFLRYVPTTAAVAEQREQLALPPSCIAGLLLHPGPESVNTAGLPRGYIAASLEELAAFDWDGRLMVDPDALNRAVAAAMRPVVSARPGRPSGLEGTRTVLQWIGDRGLMPDGYNATARAVHEHWVRALPGTLQPAYPTIRGHLRKIISAR